MKKQNRLREGQIDALIHVARTVNSHLELDDVLRSIMAVATEVLQAEAASLVLVDEETDELEFHVATGEKAESLSAFRLKRGTGIVGHVIESREPIIVNDAQSDPRFYSKVDDGTGFVTRSILCVPMARGNSVWGAIEVLNRIGDQPFTTEDQTLCEAISGQAAIALENAMLHKQLLEHERLAAVGETVAGLAHCVRNVLSGIEGGTYLVDLGLSEGDASTIRQGWEIVRRKNAIVQDLVLNMLNYSKERTPDYEPVDINELLSGAVDLMSGQASERRVRLLWTPTRDMPVVSVEPKGIRRCLFNLVGNAIDACNGKEDCTVSLRVEALEKEAFAIEVRDTGCGIDPANLKRLFEPFFSTKGAAGTGLGLAVTHKIVTEHGGRLTVDSTSGEGSCFRMILPIGAVEQKVLADAGQTTEASSGTPQTFQPAISLGSTQGGAAKNPRFVVKEGTSILLVDDDPDILTFLEAALWSFEGLDVHTARDGVHGIELAQELQPNLIILDLQMPRKDGLSTFRDLRANEATRDIPVVILTGAKEKTGIGLSATDMGGYIGHEPDGYLHKPIYPAVLQRKVAEILRLGEMPDQIQAAASGQAAD